MCSHLLSLPLSWPQNNLDQSIDCPIVESILLNYTMHIWAFSDLLMGKLELGKVSKIKILSMVVAIKACPGKIQNFVVHIVKTQSPR